MKILVRMLLAAIISIAPGVEPGPLRIDIFQRPPQIDGVEPELSKRIILLIGYPA